MEWMKVWDWIRSLSPYGKALVLIAAAAALAAMLFGVTGCSISHRTTQSMYNKTTGDSIIMKYEMEEKARKN